MFCREHVAQLRDHQAEFRARGARLAAIGMGDPGYARAFRDESGIDFPLLVDLERAAYRAVELRSATLRHMFRRDNWLARQRARRAGHRQGRTGQHAFQLGGSFVFGPGDVDRYARPSATFGDALPVVDLLAAVGR